MWIIFAVLAAVVWGLDYALADRVVHRISVTSFMSFHLLVAFLIATAVGLFSGSLKKDLVTINASRELILFLVVGAIAFTAGNFLILNSISSKNATLAGMIEISYPLFIAFFTYLLFKQNQVSLATAVGGLLIFSGVFTIYFFNK